MNRHHRAIALNPLLSAEARGLYFILISYEAETGTRLFDQDAKTIESVCSLPMSKIWALNDELINKHLKKNKWKCC